MQFHEESQNWNPPQTPTKTPLSRKRRIELVNIKADKEHQNTLGNLLSVFPPSKRKSSKNRKSVHFGEDQIREISPKIAMDAPTKKNMNELKNYLKTLRKERERLMSSSIISKKKDNKKITKKLIKNNKKINQIMTELEDKQNELLDEKYKTAPKTTETSGGKSKGHRKTMRAKKSTK